VPPDIIIKSSREICKTKNVELLNSHEQIRRFKMFTTSFSMATKNVMGVVSNIFKPIIILGLISEMLQLIKYFGAFTFIQFSDICLLTIPLPQINSFSQYLLLMLMMQIFTTL